MNELYLITHVCSMTIKNLFIDVKNIRLLFNQDDKYVCTRWRNVWTNVTYAIYRQKLLIDFMSFKQFFSFEFDILCHHHHFLRQLTHYTILIIEENTLWFLSSMDCFLLSTTFHAIATEFLCNKIPIILQWLNVWCE